MQALLLRYDKHIGYNMKQEIQKRIDQIKAGQIPDGYSRTSLGIFPCDWEIDKSFSELFSFHSNLGKSREELCDNGICYLHYGDMHRNSSYIAKYSDYLYEPKYDISLFGKEDFLMQDGDIAFLDASEDLSGTSRAVLIDNPDNEPFIAGLHTILAKERGTAFAKYFKQYITISQDVRKQFQRLAVGFKVYGLNKDTLGWIRISYPKSIKEQEKIAQVLMTWDKAIELQEKYIRKLNLNKKILMHCLFKSEGDWRSEKLEKLIVLLTSGGTPPTSNNAYFNGDVIWVSIDDMSKAEKYIDNSLRKLTNLGLENSSAKLFPAGTVLYAMYASIGKTAIAKVSCATSQAILGIVADENKLDNEYLYYYLCYIQERILLQGQKGTQSNLNKMIVSKFDIDLPYVDGEIDIGRQKLIAKILSNADEGIILQNQKLEKLKEQRKSLQQLLLTGIVRV